MPNYCKNKLTVVGPAGRVAEFIKKAKGTCQHYKPAAYELAEMADRVKRGLPAEEPERDEVFSFHQLVPIPDEVMAREYDGDEGRALKATGYEVEHKLWGVKWGGSETKLVAKGPGSVTYTYTTPWGPAKTFIETVSKNWPDLLFAVSFSEESPSRGRFTANAGTLTHIYQNEKCGIDFGGDNLTEKDEEKLGEMSDEWQDAHLYTHDAWAATLGAKTKKAIQPRKVTKKSA